MVYGIHHLLFYSVGTFGTFLTHYFLMFKWNKVEFRAKNIAWKRVGGDATKVASKLMLSAFPSYYSFDSNGSLMKLMGWERM